MVATAQVAANEQQVIPRDEDMNLVARIEDEVGVGIYTPTQRHLYHVPYGRAIDTIRSIKETPELVVVCMLPYDSDKMDTASMIRADLERLAAPQKLRYVIDDRKVAQDAVAYKELILAENEARVIPRNENDGYDEAYVARHNLS